MAEHYDILVIGSGLAGLSFALEAASSATVAVITKRNGTDSNTNVAQGGIAAVVGDDDSFEEHIANTLAAGDGLGDREIIELCVSEGPQAVERLRSWGVQFAKDLGREGGHTRRRVLHSSDVTGRDIQQALLGRVREHRNIHLLEEHTAIDLVRERASGRAGRVNGAYVLDEASGEVRTFAARVVVLATGGSGKVYLYTSNPDVATGDGVAMAWRAKAKVANMEFFQFHPTCLFHPKAKSFLLSEAMRGEGGVLRRADGSPLMDEVHPMGSLAPRDIVARAIDMEMKRTGSDCVFLDLTALDATYLADRFPTILATVEKYGIDWRTDPIPVVPAAHYQCGGVLVDRDGRASLGGLYAVGEVSCTGLHGANRLASNSLLEAAVFSRRAAIAACAELSEAREVPEIPAWSRGYATPGDEWVVVSHTWDEIRRLMWNYVGIVRSNKRLERARRRIALLKGEIYEDWWRWNVTRDSIELRNIAQVAELIVEGARLRQESRGLHHHLDFPDSDPTWLRPTVLWRGTR